MLIDEACISCIINQSVKVAAAINADDALSSKLTSEVQELSKNFSYADTPPEIASFVYEKMAHIAHMDDLYSEIKKVSTKKAISFLPLLKNKLLASDDMFLTSTKIAIAGNVMDLAAEVEFDLKEELDKIFETPFAHNDFLLFKDKFLKAKTVLIIGDNVGEHIFDFVYMQTFQELNPSATYFYMVRGNPIINDVTLKEAQEAGFHKICEVVDSGVNTPGFVYERANDYSKQLFESADLIISKGMGNYECMTPPRREGICFLLKVKCGVVASSLSLEVGDIVCKMV